MCASITPDVTSPTKVKNIDLLAQLPSGANGTVFFGHDKMLKRDVVVKFWEKKKDNDKRDKKKQALEESIKIAKLDHPNIVKVYYGEIEDDIFYLVMEFVPGITLNEKLKFGDKLSFTERRSYWYAIADALSYAYKQKIYHGDLHDKNILIDGVKTKLIDFGTSFFCKRKSNSKEREVQLLSELICKIFPDLNERLLPQMKKIRNKPEIFLHVCDARFQISRCLEIIYDSLVDIERNSFTIRSEILGMSKYCATFPFFDYRAIVNEMQRKKVPDYFILEFLNSCITCSKLIMLDSINPVSNTEHMKGSTEEYLKELENWSDKCEEKLLEKHRDGYQSLLEYIT